MSPETTVREYYEALRRGEPLYPFFAEDGSVVKVGVGERLVGYDAVAEGLREQSRTTTDWTVESRDLRTVDRGDHAAFADAVRMAWRDAERDREYDFETRWSGTLERRPDADDAEWVFLGMHVSCSVPRAEDGGFAWDGRGWPERGETDGTDTRDRTDGRDQTNERDRTDGGDRTD